MKKFLLLAGISGVVLLLGCPGKKNSMGASADCGCRTVADSNSICASFVNGRCGFCADQTCTEGDFCSYLPRDVDFLQKSEGYAEFSPVCQNAFDWFSWQSFIALNWPADSAGNPLNGPFTSNPSAPRVWESYLTMPEVFGGATRNTSGFLALGSNTKAGPHVFQGQSADLEPGSDKPLIDRNLNFTLYEIRINSVQAEFIKQYGLTTWCGQKTYYDSVSQTVTFPTGSYEKDEVGSIEIKTAWRVLIPGVDDSTHFFTRQAIITVPAENVVTKVAISDTVTVGLVGLHLVRNVSTEGNAWIWSSFEQVENAPECPDGKCPGDSTMYSFYNPSCATCSLNTAPSAAGNNFLWSVAQGSSRQYGRQYATGGYGSQIGRINPVEKSTDSISTIWRNKLKKAGSVWQYYRLIGSQWKNVEGSHGITLGIPPKQANTAMESYLQVYKPEKGSGSCMSCHGFATGVYPKLNANLSFTLKRALMDTGDCSGTGDLKVKSKK